VAGDRIGVMGWSEGGIVELRAQSPWPIDYVVYPSATHGFDDPEFGDGITFLGHQMRHDAAATSDSMKRITAFLRGYLKGEYA
jgi:dienelactone hydrolase